MDQHLQPPDLAGKVIDGHSHVGLSFKSYASLEYPYGQTLEGLYYRQLACDVDVNVIFPYAAELYWDFDSLLDNRLEPAANRPTVTAPYVVENRMLLTEVFLYCPEIAARFLPFVSVHPTVNVAAQISALDELAAEFPVYGIKISPVFCRAPLRARPPAA